MESSVKILIKATQVARKEDQVRANWSPQGKPRFHRSPREHREAVSNRLIQWPRGLELGLHAAALLLLGRPFLLGKISSAAADASLLLQGQPGCSGLKVLSKHRALMKQAHQASRPSIFKRHKS